MLATIFNHAPWQEHVGPTFIILLAGGVGILFCHEPIVAASNKERIELRKKTLSFIRSSWLGEKIVRFKTHEIFNIGVVEFPCLDEESIFELRIVPCLDFPETVFHSGSLDDKNWLAEELSARLGLNSSPTDQQPRWFVAIYDTNWPEPPQGSKVTVHQRDKEHIQIEVSRPNFFDNWFFNIAAITTLTICAAAIWDWGNINLLLLDFQVIVLLTSSVFVFNGLIHRFTSYSISASPAELTIVQKRFVFKDPWSAQDVTRIDVDTPPVLNPSLNLMVHQNNEVIFESLKHCNPEDVAYVAAKLNQVGVDKSPVGDIAVNATNKSNVSSLPHSNT